MTLKPYTEPSICFVFIGALLAARFHSVQAVSFTIQEESGASVIGSIRIPHGETYRLSPPNDLFELNGNTGELRTTKSIDRESLEKDVINLLAVASSAGSLPPIDISVEVTDVNDNDPVFPAFTHFELEIPESTDVGAQYILPTATDADAPSNSVSSQYQIEDGDVSKFELLVNFVPGIETLLYLRTLEKFNRELKDHYTLNISATDDGSPARQGFLQVDVTILDNNDNEPDFEFSEYQTEIDENATIGFHILTVKANDADQGDNGLVKYRIATNSESRDIFNVDADTGVITLKKSLDREIASTHRLTLEAYDSGDPVLFGRTFVTVNVKDINDNDPVLTVRFIPSSASIVSVNDHSPPDTLAALLVASDKDSEGALELFIEGGNELDHFKLASDPTGKFGRLLVKGPINRSETPRYNLTIGVRDSGTPIPRTSYKSFEVVVNSANDHVAAFTKPTYRATISELAPLGSYVTDVAAQDPDVGLPGRSIYSIADGNDLNWFEISSSTGLITTKLRLRYEELAPSSPLVSLLVVARDESTNPRSASASVEITIVDENDNAPRFVSNTYNVTVPENVAPFNIPTTTSASDVDTGNGGKVVYSIDHVFPSTYLEDYDTLSKFDIDPDSGALRVVSPLSKSEKYDLVIRATDQGDSPLTSTVTVHVTVEAHSNVPPVFYPTNYYVIVSPGRYVNHKVTTVKATIDGAVSDDIQYEIISGVNGFTINSKTGVITVSSTLISSSTRMIFVNAESERGLLATSFAKVIISVRNDDDIPLQFSRTSFEFVALENIDLSTTIGFVTISETSEAGEITYDIVDGDPNGLFTIDNSTGLLRRSQNGKLDFEMSRRHDLTVVSKLHSAGGALSGFALSSCAVIVRDINDNFPAFQGSAKRLNRTIRSDYMIYSDDTETFAGRGQSGFGSFVYNSSATDADSGKNGVITYTLKDALNLFDINRKGIITWSSTTMISTDRVYDITVLACDSGSPRLCSELRLQIFIRAWLGNYFVAFPVTSALQVTLPESTSVNTRFIDLSQTLPPQFKSPVKVFGNGDILQIISYAISNGNANEMFGIFPDGVVYLKNHELDREKMKDYTLSVTVNVTDYVQSYTQSVLLSIHVEDINDNAPLLNDETTSFLAKENLPAGTIIGYIRGIDKDVGIHATLLYELSRSYAYQNTNALPFVVDAISGAITTTCTLNREIIHDFWNLTTIDTMDLSVSAKDNGGADSVTSLVTQTTIDVRIQDVNEFPPEFSKQLYQARISENSRNGDLVIQVSATDKDGSDGIKYKFYPSVKSSSFPFGINTTTGRIFVVHENELDRESVESYRFTVIAEDLGLPLSFSSMTTVEVQLLDVNDEIPYFNSSLTLQVSEAAFQHQHVGRVHALDEDESGLNSMVRYFIASETSESARNTFTIDEPSGIISLIGPVDRETIASYELIVIAADSGDTVQNTATATMTIAVTDENDNKPIFSPISSLRFPEGNYQQPLVFGTVAATDMDSDENGKITYEVIGQKPTTAGMSIQVEGDSGRLTVSGNVDREKYLPGGLLQITIKATDNAPVVSDRLWTTATFDVTVVDVNDNAPVFTSPDAVFIPPGSVGVVGFEIATVIATDSDEGLNGSVSYSIFDGGSTSPFTIEPSTGILQLNTPLPGDSVLHAVSVVARDQGTPSLYNMMTLNVIVGGATLANGPVFTATSFSGSLSEDSDPGASILTLTTIGNQVAYYIFGVTPTDISLIRAVGRPFAVDASSGLITNVIKLDRENGVTSYTVDVLAVDLLSSQLSPRMTAAKAIIDVTDVNDSPPLFADAITEESVSESAQNGYELTTQEAIDADDNSILVYSLDTGNGSEDFVIDRTTGRISVGQNGLDREKISTYTLKITVDDGIHSSRTLLIVDVMDINDHKPQFTSDNYVIRIEEGSSALPSGTKFIGSVHADDADSGINSMIRYSFVNDSDQGRFLLDPSNGILHLSPTFSAEVDRESQDFYVFSVRAMDGGGFFNDAIVYLNIADVNDNLPVFKDHVREVEIQEDVELGYYVTKIRATDADLDFNGFVEYQIVAGDPMAQFIIKPDSGEITVQKLLDRERQSAYDLVIMATDLAEPTDRLSSFTNLTVKVLDVNDNPPELIMPPAVYIPEGTSPGTEVLNIDAFDLDEVDSVFTYTLISQIPSVAFQLDPKSGSLTVVAANLDHEVTGRFLLTVSVSDGGFLTASRNLDVVITDVNNNAPTFSSMSVVANIPEDAPTGSFITQVQASDRDKGWNGFVKYRLLYSEGSNKIQVDSTTGVIYLIGKLDYEETSGYELFIQSYDSGVPSLSANITVFINVEDVNDCEPILSPDYALVNVAENMDSVVDIVQFQVFDNDTGNGGRVDFRAAVVTSVVKDGVAASGSYDDLFRITNTGRLQILRAVDREEVERFTVVVTAVDRGFPSLSGSASVLISIKDVNEHTPVFKPRTIRAAIAENATVGTQIFMATAFDEDGGEYGVLSYAIISPETNLPFIIDPSDGAILLSQPLNYEERPQYTFTIVATDSSDSEGSARSSSASVTVHVLDVNDHFPEFMQSSFDFFAPTSGGVCGVVWADDRDAKENGRVSYALLSSDTALPFEIDSATGVISSTAAFSLSSYQFQVQAIDHGYNRLSSVANITVVVNNDVYPVFTSSPSTTFSIMENTSPESDPLFTFQATSSRSGSLDINYKIVGGNLNDCFALDQTTGQLRRVKSLDREITSTFYLWMEAKDSGRPTLSSYTSMTVKVLDFNDNAPKFSMYMYSGSIPEGVVGRNIITLSATDPDTNAGGVLDFSIVEVESEYPERFQIDSSGTITNSVPLDREEKETYYLTVSASDKDNLASSATVIITVEDVNDDPPSFTRLFSATVKENAAVGDYVIQITSFDLDTAENAQNQYRFRPTDNFNDTFVIDSVTGTVRVNKKLDREKQASYQLLVEAEDGAWVTNTQVDITVSDVNDNAPKFTNFNRDFRILNETSADSLIFSLASTDADEGQNQEVWYNIESSTDYFTINHTTGEVFSTNSLTCSPTDASRICPLRYGLTVSATDSGTPQPLSTSVTVDVIIVASNTHFPLFRDDYLFPVAVLQSQPAGSTVLSVTASDEDGDIITYVILEGGYSSYFDINLMTGVITSSQSLLRLTLRTEISLIVRATDNGLPRKFSDLVVTLEVAESNNNRPAFLQHSYTASPVDENASIGSFVVKVDANDNDHGINGEVQYSLHVEDADKPFRINSTTGVISVSSHLDYETKTSYHLTVIASDRAVTSLSDQTRVEIPINDVNDQSPRFNSSYFVAYVTESIPPRTHVTRIQATDSDSGENAIGFYSIAPQKELMIRTLTGDISTAPDTYLDYETTTNLNFEVIVSDGAIASFTDRANLTLHIIDVNEYAPEFVSPVFSFFTSVNSAPGEAITQLNVTDADGGSRGVVFFHLAGWSEGRGFEIDRFSGELSVSEGATLDLGDKIPLTIIAKNPGSYMPDKTAMIDVEISIVTDECLREPCKNGGTCQDGPESFICSCALGYSGQLCEIDIDDCVSNPCKNDATCTDLVADFECNCPVGYEGKVCDQDIDFCFSAPCLNGGTCKDGLQTDTCQCPFGASGNNCEVNSLGFESLSYLTLPTLDQASNRIAFEFATVSTSALLFYNHAQHGASFVALEVIDGGMRLSYNLGAFTDNRATSLNVGEGLDDGSWHHVTVVIDSAGANVTLDRCLDFSNGCFVFQSHSDSSSRPFANLQTENLYFGGIPDLTVITERPNQISSYDFVGCIREFDFNNLLVESTSSSAIVTNSHVVNGCPRSNGAQTADACTTQVGTKVCGEGSSCVDQWSSVLCQCTDDRSGKTCQNTRTGSTFNGNSFLAYNFLQDYIQQSAITASGALLSPPSRKKRETVPTESSISVRFRTRQSNGLIYFIKSPTTTPSASLQVENKALVYTFSTSTGMMEQTVTSDVTNGQWHTAVVRIVSMASDVEIFFSVDGEEKGRETYSGGIMDFSDPTQVETIYVGGAPTDLSLPSFNGCVFSFKINNQSQPLADDGGSSLLTVQNGSSGSAVELGCTGKNVCASSPCPALLYCKDVWNDYECIPLGSCLSSPCLNNGDCKPGTGEFYSCQCSTFFSGQNCETYIPCIDFSCGSHQVCEPSVAEAGNTTCRCADGNASVNGECVATGGVDWWVFLVAALASIIVFALVIWILRKWHISRLVKGTATPGKGGSHTAKTTPAKLENGNGQIGRSNESYEFDQITNSSRGNLPRPDLLSEDVRIVDAETVILSDQSTSLMASPKSTESSSIRDLSPDSPVSMPIEAPQPKPRSLANSNVSKSHSPLPSYEALMRERKESSTEDRNSDKISSSASTLPANYASDRELITDRTMQKRSRFRFDSPDIQYDLQQTLPDSSSASRSASSVCPPSSVGSKSHSSSTYHPRSVISMKDSLTGSPSSRNTSSTAPPRTMNFLAIKTPYITNGKTSPYLPRDRSGPLFSMDRASPYFLTGKTSPVKNPSHISFKDDRLLNQGMYTPSLHAEHRQTPSSNYSRKISGSMASSTNSSSSSSDPAGLGSQAKPATIVDMVQQINGFVGLTNDEIEALNENPQASFRSTSASSHSSSVDDPPSTARDKNICLKGAYLPPHLNPANRPSSLPGRRIDRVPVTSRSKTPMLSQPAYPYKPSAAPFPVYPALPVHLQPSDLMQPPDTSSDEDDEFYPGRFTGNKKKDLNAHHESDPVNRAGLSTTIPDGKNGLQLDFLMPYGRQYEGLAAIFEELAALPSHDDNDDITSGTYSETSLTVRNVDSQLATRSTPTMKMSYPSKDHQNTFRPASHGTRSRSSMSPSSATSRSSTSQSTNRKRQELYV
ncbi:unnamed protein product [Clavelina lepadiformis]|uniref:Protocadherin Fat 4 n=1 Tax=Clavelina lepadiformis TaxID=159417 RepID=A0ABP0H2R1_CLALP